jgi:hypothetical protein
MEDATTEYNDLVNYLQENGMEPFERIWIFRRHNPEIVFDSAEIFPA